ncbi:unnamed protein product [Cuscuta europaea]|uniref:Reverse transcriptase zinc-binding domain-containing protein n=1 Tax=Cuscuta europaea TaxID=41803 RepID=A0A9P0ZZA4_CUSEU|nr:unnamed protein product [Cuscuta europaea]
MKLFFWQVMTKVLPTTENLRRRRVDVPSECQVCNSESESTLHFSNNCSIITELWAKLGLNFQQQYTSMSEWVQFVFDRLSEEKLCVLISTLWRIWKARNDVVWRGDQSNFDQVIAAGAATMHRWRTAQEVDGQLPQARDARPRWSKPAMGVIKINVGALDDRRGTRSWGWVVRDDKGTFFHGGSETWT